MSEKYIRKNKTSYSIIKNSTNYGRYQTLEDAIIARNILTDENWQLNRIDNLYHINDTYIVTNVADEKLHIIAKYKKPPSEDKINDLIRKHSRNPNNSKYGLNIIRIYDTYIIKKQIMGEEIIYGYYSNLNDAEFVRNHLMDNMWDTDSFSKVMHDGENDNYRITQKIDDKIYIIDTYDLKDEIDLEKSYLKFLDKIRKHAERLEIRPELDELTPKIPELEKLFNVKLKNDNINEILFKLTPFQKAAYDNVDNNTLEDIEKRLNRFRSKNFQSKIQKNLDDLIKLDLITKKGDYYMKMRE